MQHRFIFGIVSIVSILIGIGLLNTPAYATAANSVTLDRSDFYYNGHGVVVTVDHPDSAPNNPAVQDTTTIIVKTCNDSLCTSPYFTCGSVTVTETTATSRIFVSSALKLLTSGATCPNLNGPAGKYVKATYGVTFSSVIPINNPDDEDGCSATSPPSSTCQALASSSSFYFPKDADAIGFAQDFDVYTCSQLGKTDGSDNDGICDEWELPAGTTSGNFVIDFNEPGTGQHFSYSMSCGTPGSVLTNGCPTRGTDDVLVEIDALKHHMPSASTIDMVKSKFSLHGINLIYQLDEEIPFHKNSLSRFSLDESGSLLSSASDTDRVKAYHFGVAGERNDATKLHSKRQVFHYALFTHQRLDSSTSSGWAEMPGNDVQISLGSFTQGIGSADEQAAAFMHEFGHNLGLDHGGASDPINCKPNYLSVMNYAFEFPTYVNRPLDYSNSVLDTLNEGSTGSPALIDSRGVTPDSSANTAYGPSPVRTANVGDPIDWDRDGVTTDTSTADINNFGISGCTASTGETLVGSNDWNNVNFIFQSWTSARDGASCPEDICPISSDDKSSPQIRFVAFQDEIIETQLKEEIKKPASIPLEVSYFDVMEMRNQTILYLKELVEQPNSVPGDIKDEVIKNLEDAANFVKPVNFEKDQDISNTLDDHLDLAIGSMTTARDLIDSSDTNGADKKTLLDAFDEKIDAFASAAEPAHKAPPGRQVLPTIPHIFIITIGVFIAFAILLFALRAVGHEHTKANP